MQAVALKKGERQRGQAPLNKVNDKQQAEHQHK